MTLHDSIDDAIEPQVRDAGKHYAASISSFERPDNTTAYAAGDVVGPEAASALEFIACAARAGGSGTVVSAIVTVDEAMGTVPDLELWLFEAEPTNAADNAALALADAVVPIGVLYFEADNVLVGNASSSPAGMIALQSTAPIDIPFVCAQTSRSLYGLLVTRTIFTPVAETKFVIRIAVERT